MRNLSKILIFLLFLNVLSGCSIVDSSSMIKEAFSRPAPEAKSMLYRPANVLGNECRQIFRDPFGRDYFQSPLESGALKSSSASAVMCLGEAKMTAMNHIRLRKKAEEIKESPLPIPDVVVKSIKTGVYLYTWMAVG